MKPQTWLTSIILALFILMGKGSGMARAAKYVEKLLDEKDKTAQAGRWEDWQGFSPLPGLAIIGLAASGYLIYRRRLGDVKAQPIPIDKPDSVPSGTPTIADSTVKDCLPAEELESVSHVDEKKL
jgi:hypothetical protein